MTHSPRTSHALTLSLRPEDRTALESARRPREAASTAALRLLRMALGVTVAPVKRGRPRKAACRPEVPR